MPPGLRSATVHDALGAARGLALTRIVAGLIIATSADVHGAVRFAGLDAQLVMLPAGLDWLAPLALSSWSAQLLRWTVVFAALVGATGAYAQVAFAATTLGALVLLALPQRLGAVAHVHHLVWIAALLAASPCADVWSADAYFSRRELRPRASYVLPLCFVRLLIAAIYFFPGAHKLSVLLQGTDPGSWLRSHLHWKWMQAGRAPQLPFELDNGVARLLALGAVAFELSMPLLIALRRTRPLALLLALAFHAVTAWLLFIRFETLLALLVALIDLPPRPSGSQHPLLAFRSGWLSTRVVGLTLVAGACVTGALGLTQWYPFACYPTFAEPAPTRMPSARVELIGPAGRCALPRPRANAEWVQAFRVASAYGDVLTPARLHAYTARVLQTRAGCPLSVGTTVVLSVEALTWDDATGRPLVLRERPVYSAPASSFGVAPAEGRSDSISPPR